MKRNIKKLLKHAPAISTPNDLKYKLQTDVNLNCIKKEPSVIHRWFFCPDKSLSFRRVAGVAMITLVFLIPFSYGATKIAKFIVTEFKVIYEGDENTKCITAFAFNPTINGDCIRDDEDAKKAEKEMLKLIEECKAEEISPGEYKATISLGGEVTYDTLGIPLEILTCNERQERIKELTDEILELRKTGNFKKTFLKELENVGKNKITVCLYEESFVLSNNKTIKLTCAYEVKK